MSDVKPIVQESPTGDRSLPSVSDSPPKKRKWGGGPDTHKPGCRCNACVARRRKAEALNGRAGESDPIPSLVPQVSVQTINGDEPLPPLVEINTSQRGRVAQWVQMRLAEPGITTAECARRMGLAPITLASYISRGRKAGWLVFDDPMSRLEHEIIPKVTDNLNYYLDMRDRTVTIETAKGTLFKQYQAEQGIQEGAQTVLAIKIEYPQDLIDSPEIKVVSGNIVGKPKLGN